MLSWSSLQIADCLYFPHSPAGQKALCVTRPTFHEALHVVDGQYIFLAEGVNLVKYFQILELYICFFLFTGFLIFLEQKGITKK